MEEKTITEILELGSVMDARRQPWDALWQEQSDICHPRRSLTQHRAPYGTTPEQGQIASSFDGTAQRANRTLANGQAARITPMGSRWFALRPPEALSDSPAAVSWYQYCGETLARALAGSNFYNIAKEHYLDRGAFGTAATEIVAGKGGRGLHFRSYPIGTYSVAEDDFSEIDTLTRLIRLTPKQILQMFGDTDTPACVLKKLADPHTALEPLEVRYTIRPRAMRDPRKIDKKNKAYEATYILCKERILLREEGFDEFPLAVSRWETWGDSPYGWAPSLLALPEAAQANFIEQMKDTLLEVSAFPRVLYPSNLKGDVNFRALGLTCYDPGNGQTPQEWLTQGRYDIAKDGANDKRRAIEEAFYVPLFNAISQLDRDATATEVRAIVSESRELFHPIFANLIREFQGPLLKRCFNILLRQGAFPPPPAAVLGQGDLGMFVEEPAVEYTSTMALALEQSQIANFADCINVIAPLAQFDPSVFDSLDTDEILPAFFRYKGLPETFIRTPEAVAAMREQRAQAQQAAAAAEAAKAVSSLGGAQGIQDLSNLSNQQ
jgi:hypothetical protein